MTEEEIAAADLAQFKADKSDLQWRWGWQLSKPAKKQALAAFPHRHTAETPSSHRAAQGAAITFETDEQWLHATRFAVAHGRLDPRADRCATMPAFPRAGGLWRLPGSIKKKCTEVLTTGERDLTCSLRKPETES